MNYIGPRDNTLRFSLKRQSAAETTTKRAPRPCFCKKLRDGVLKNETTLKLIDRAMDVRTDHPRYQNNNFNQGLRLYSVCLHEHCLRTL